MTFGIIGAGNIGGTMAQLLVRAGHRVIISNRRGGDSLDALLARIGSSARSASVEEAAREGDIVLLAVPFRNPEALPPPDAVAGKIVIDAMNAYASKGGSVIDLGASTSSEETRRRLPGARLVKAFNTIAAGDLASQGDTSLPEDDRRAIFVAADDPDAKATVAEVIRQLGYAPVDTGSLHEGGLRQQPGTAVYNRRLTARDARGVLAAV